MEAKTRSVQEIQYSTTRTGARSFLGLCSVYHRFVPGFSKMAAALNKKLRKEELEKFSTLTKAKIHSVNALENAPTNLPMLFLQRANGQYTIHTDASDTQVGCVLLQTQEDGTDTPIGYLSQTQSDLERKRVTTDKKSLAVEHPILLLRPHAETSWFTVRTDREALKWLMTLSEAS